MEILTNFKALAMVFLFFGASIFVHELGHFLAARWRGLKVTRFSIGFGHYPHVAKHIGAGHNVIEGATDSYKHLTSNCTKGAGQTKMATQALKEKEGQRRRRRRAAAAAAMGGGGQEPIL